MEMNSEIANRRKVKVAVLVRDLANGGMQGSVVKLANGLSEITDLIVLEDNIQFTLSGAKKLHILNLRQTKMLFVRLFQYIRIVTNIISIVEDRNIDLIMSFGYSMNVLAVIVKKLSKSNVRVVCGIRNSELEYRRHAKRTSLLPLLVPVSNKIADQIIVNSEELKNELIKSGIDGNKTRVIYNGYDLEKINLLSLEQNEKLKFIDNRLHNIVFVGRLSAQKNIKMLLKAFSIVLKSMDVSLILVGDGEEKNSIENEICELNIKSNVYFVGNQSNPYPFMKSASVVVLSSFFEGFPNVLVEAMICGAPIVSVDCPHGPKEILKEGGGVLVPSGDYRSMANEIIEIIKDSERRNLLSIEATKRARDFDVSKMIASTRNVFENVTKEL